MGKGGKGGEKSVIKEGTGEGMRDGKEEKE